MKILVACEYSGRVRDAFIARGHDAISCDLLPTDVDGPHHQGDCIPIIKQGWDIIIMHPPCTALTVSGNRTYGEGQPKHEKRIESVKWTVELFNLARQHARVGVCMENPVGVIPRLGGLPCTQYIQPWMFGHMECKKTGLWLDRLPPLVPTNDVREPMMLLPEKQRNRVFWLGSTKDRWKLRSTTYQGVADAMAAQWG